MRLVVAVTSLTILVACAPPPLSAPPDAGGGSADTRTDPVPFSDVAGILRNDCNGDDCHGEAGRAGLQFENGADASDDEIRQALEGTTVDGEEAKFIEPGAPQDSVLFLSLKALDGRQKMPLTDRLEDEKIETIRLWIAQGASYE